MQHVFRVDVIERRTHARNVEDDVPLLEDHLLLQVMAKVTSDLQVKQKVAIAPTKVGTDVSG